MTTYTPATDPALQTADYILSRLTTWLGSKAEHFNAFIDGNVRAEGWLPAEAFFALSTPVACQNVTVSTVRGKAQGSA